ncbi:MAG: sulfate adenylyltransferase [Limnobacter sp.]|nr:sulfate adenylyltransferase [Limnobacter sp.]
MKTLLQNPAHWAVGAVAGSVLASLCALYSPHAHATGLVYETMPNDSQTLQKSPGPTEWQQLFNEELTGSATPVQRKLTIVNDFWNSLHQVTDERLYGQADVWTTPFETLKMGAGDCEDMAIGKYFSLVKAGVNEDRLRIAHVSHYRYGAHMVVLFTDDAKQQWVLDSLSPNIKTLENRSDLNLVYSLNRKALVTAKYPQYQADPMRLTKWAGLMARIRPEEQGDVRTP